MKNGQFVTAIALAVVSTSGISAQSLNVHHKWTFNHTVQNDSASLGSEILAYDSVNEQIWVVGINGNAGGVDVLDLQGNLVNSIDTSAFGGVNSVAIKNGQAAIALTAPKKTDPGSVRFYNATTFDLLSSVEVGANPDSVTYTPDGARLLVANEGEPINYTTEPDPEGSVSIINTSTFAVQTANFNAFDASAADLKNAGVRLTGPNASGSQDVEPEYIAVSADGTRALATLQEANAIAVIDIANAAVLDIQPLGKKDHSLTGNGLDASDSDGINGNIQTWENLQGLYMPDGIASVTKNGQQYYVTANEGDSREWAGGADEVRISGGSLTVDPDLDDAMKTLYGDDWRTDTAALARLNVSRFASSDPDSEIESLEAFGARSFSILDANGSILFDSGDDIEQIVKKYYPSLWDDGRSDNKGPEPESVIVGQIEGKDLIFLALERSNAIMVWDFLDVGDLNFLGMIFHAGDIAPEGLSFFVNESGSYLGVANEGSRTTTLYRLSLPAGDPATLWLLAPALAGLLRFARRKN